MGKTQLDMVLEIITKCPCCGKTKLSEKDKENIFFKNKCLACIDEEEHSSHNTGIV